MEQEIGSESVETSSPQEIESQSDSLASDLASDLYPDSQRTQPEEVEEAEVEIEAEEEESSEPEVEEKPAEEAVTRTPPKSWTKEMQAKYASLPPEIQDYVVIREKQMADGLEKDRSDANLGRVMRDTMTPYRAMLQAQGVNEAQAVQSLMNVHYKLTNLPMVEKTTYLANIAKSYGIDLSSIPQEPQEQIDPTIKRLQDELNGIKQSLTTNQQNAINQAHERVAKDVEAFASDSNHPYFDEVADDIAAMIQVGHDLETAYEKAVWANPVTRQKEIARLQTEQEATLKEKAKAAADTARKAASLNVKTRDTSKAPTGPKATMRNLDSALEESMREIRSRTH